MCDRVHIHRVVLALLCRDQCFWTETVENYYNLMKKSLLELNLDVNICNKRLTVVKDEQMCCFSRYDTTLK